MTHCTVASTTRKEEHHLCDDALAPIARVVSKSLCLRSAAFAAPRSHLWTIKREWVG